MKDDCLPKLQDAGLQKDEAQRLLHGMSNAAQLLSADGISYEEALKNIAGEMSASEGAWKSLLRRNTLLNISAKRRMKEFAMRFETPGEGLVAFMEGSNKKVEGARLSVDYQGKATHQKYFGALVAGLEDAEVLKTFMSGKLDREIYTEMGELGKDGGMPGASGSPDAMKIAKIIEGVTDEMVSRQNRAGAFISKLPGYVVRQTHDNAAIRLAGGGGNNPESKTASLKAWSDFTMPLLDPAKTFKGADPVKFMRNVHEGLYTGVHGDITGEADIVSGFSMNLGKKASKERVLHFKDAEAAYQYNQQFGSKNLRDQLFSDVYFRARNIALMENFGPNAEDVLRKTIRELGEETRTREDAGKMVDSLKDWKIMAAFNTISGKNDLPANYGLSKVANTIRSLASLSKMGGTIISSISDKGFFQTEMAFQGIDALKTFGKQISLFAGQSPEGERMLRLMGVGLDGLIGNTVSRYTMHTSVAGVGHRLQQKLFDINFLNWWTDIHKGAAAELMSGHLGEHAHVPFDQLPGDLKNVLSLYDIKGSTWDALRSTAWTREDTGAKFVTADKVRDIPDEAIDAILKEQDRGVTEANRERMRDSMESRLRTYISDRVDYAIPSPGAAERRLLTMNTQAGTPLGEAVRMLTLFKSFPLAIIQKVMARDVYGNGANNIKDWLLHDTKGKFRIAQTIALTTALGYLSGVIRDTLRGRTPKEITTDGNINFDVLRDSMMRGGGAGIMGDFLLGEYDTGRRGFLKTQAGPVYGQVDPIMNIASKLSHGETHGLFEDAGKLTLDNTPFINLFYIRPVLDYYVLWNLQEMMDPGSLERMERSIEKKNHQGFFVRPSDRVTR